MLAIGTSAIQRHVCQDGYPVKEDVADTRMRKTNKTYGRPQVFTAFEDTESRNMG